MNPIEQTKRTMEAKAYGEELGHSCDEGLDYYAFGQSAAYVNTVLPTLRRIAGYKDTTGAGTYTECPNDDVHYLYEDCLEAWFEGLCETTTVY